MVSKTDAPVNSGEAAKVSKKPQRRHNPIINKRLIRHVLRYSNGQPRKNKHAITSDAYRTLSTMGHETMKSLISKAKSELSRSITPSHNMKSISAGHIIHAANCLGIPATITAESIHNSKYRNYDPTACKSSNVRKLCQTYKGKARVRKDTIPILWCVVARLVEEILSESVRESEEKGKNIRIKSNTLYNAAGRLGSGNIATFRNFVGTGVNLGL